MSSVFKRKNSPNWIASWFDHSGRRIEKSTRTTDHKLAERLAQVTVRARTAVQADAWSTALAVRRLDQLGVSKAEFDPHGRLAVA